MLVDLVDDRLNAFPLAIVATAEKSRDNPL
jgi:hypothetical protein